MPVLSTDAPDRAEMRVDVELVLSTRQDTRHGVRTKCQVGG